jgi:hypothetical protein
MRMIRKLVLGAALGVAALAAIASPAGAQQLVDAGKQGDGSGGLAFVLMTLLVVLIWAGLFFMDRVRRRREDTAPIE